MESVNRNLSLDVYLPSEERDQYQQVLGSIRRYRAACRQLYSTLLLGQQAGATITESEENGLRVTPANDRAKLVLAAAMGSAKIEKGEKVKGEGQQYLVNVGAAMAYELRQLFFAELYPNAKSFVWDSARRDVQTAWTAADPEHPRATRGWLTLQGARGPAQFNRRAIGLPVATARPKLSGNTLTLHWDKDIGEVEFRIPRLDSARYWVWRAVRDGEDGWKLGTLYLGECDGKLKAILSYSKPSRPESLDPTRVLRVQWSTERESFLRVVGPDGEQTYGSLSAEYAVGRLQQLLATRQNLELRKGACGNPNDTWGHRKGWKRIQEILSNNTGMRERLASDLNHAWTRYIVERAVAWRCGMVEVESLPADLFGQPWGWFQWKERLRYKAAERGIAVAYLPPVVE